MPEKNVKVSKVKAADPGLAFVLEVEEPNTGFDSKLKVTVEIVGQEDTYETVIDIKNTVIEPELDFIAPFGDVNWTNEIVLKKDLPFKITVEFHPGQSNAYTKSITGSIFPEPGIFDVIVYPAFGPGTVNEVPSEAKSALSHFINGFRVLFGLTPM